MGETKLVSIGTLKKGNYVVIDDVACTVTDTAVSRPGKHGHAKVRLEGVGILDGKKRVIVMPGHDNIRAPVIEKRNAQVLSVHDGVANVMDVESYETFDLAVPDELRDKCASGCVVLYWIILDDKVMKQIKTD